MSMVVKLWRATPVILVCAAVYLALSSLAGWQQLCGEEDGLHVCFGQSEWHGAGVVSGALAAALLAWELVRLAAVKMGRGARWFDAASVAFALLLLVGTAITVKTHANPPRNWPEWLVLGLSIVVALAALERLFISGRGVRKVLTRLPEPTG